MLVCHGCTSKQILWNLYVYLAQKVFVDTSILPILTHTCFVVSVIQNCSIILIILVIDRFSYRNVPYC